MKNIWQFENGLRIIPVASTAISAEGDVEVYNNKLRIYVQAAAREIVTTDQTQTLSNKTFSSPVTISGFSTGVVHSNGSGLLSSSLLVNADVSASAAIAYSKLALSNSIVNADINSAAAIAYSKLNLSASIVNADIANAAAIAYSKLASLSTGQVLAGNAGVPTATTLSGDVTVGATGTVTIANGAITNSKVNASAGIVYSKLVLTGGIVNSDVNFTAGIVYSKLDLTNGIVNADINSAAAITYSKLNLTGGVVNADISASAAIAYSKLAALSSGNILVGNGSNAATSVAMSGEATISNIGAVTLSNSAVIGKVLTGYSATIGTVAATDTILQAFSKLGGSIGSAMTSLTGDVTGTGPGATATTIANGVITNAKVNASAGIVYTKLDLTNGIVNADINSAAAIAYSKLNLATSIVNADVSASAAIAYSKLASMSTGQVLLGNAGTPTATTLSGDVTVGATGVTAIGANKVTNSQLAQITTATFKGRTTAGTGNVEDLTGTQATALLNAMVGDSGSGGTKGLAPAPSAGDTATGKFLKADGTWAIPTGTGTGDVTGPNSAVDNAIVRFDGTTGKIIQNTTQVSISDLGQILSTLALQPNSVGQYGISVANTTAAAGTGDGDYTGITSSIIDHQSNNLGTGFGFKSTIDVSTGTGGGYIGYYSQVSQTGTLSNDFYGYYTEDPGVLNANSYYGLYINGVSSGTIVTDNDAIHVVSGRSYFGGNVNINGLTASKAVVTDASKNLVTIATTSTELGYVAGVTSAIQTQLNAKQSTTLTSAHLLVGNGSNVATDVAVSGDLTLANTGAFTIANSAVTNVKIAANTIDVTTKLTGVLPSAQFPALTGDITTSATSLATTAAATQANIATLSKSTGVAVHGTNTNDSASAGYVGEVIEGTLAATAFTALAGSPSSGQYAVVTSVALTAGDWDLSGFYYFDKNGGTVTVVEYLIGTATGNNTTGGVTGSNYSSGGGFVGDGGGASIPGYRVSLAGNATYYLKVRFNYTVATPNVAGRLTARRMR